jgi:hypothetical protein
MSEQIFIEGSKIRIFNHDLASSEVITPPFERKQVTMFVYQSSSNNNYVCWDPELAKANNISFVKCKCKSNYKLNVGDTVNGILDLSDKTSPFLHVDKVNKNKNKREMLKKANTRLTLERLYMFKHNIVC